MSIVHWFVFLVYCCRFCLASCILCLDSCVPPHVYSFLFLACCFLFPVSCYLSIDSCLFHIVSCFLLAIFQFVTLCSCFFYHGSHVRCLACLLNRASQLLNGALTVCCFLFFACLTSIVCCFLFSFLAYFCLFLVSCHLLGVAWLAWLDQLP